MPDSTVSDGFDSLPESWQAEVKRLREEAKSYRTAKNAAVEAAKSELESSWSEKYKKLEESLADKDSEIQAGRHEVDRLKAALSVGIAADKAEEFASRLQGDTMDELVSDAERLKELFYVEPVQKEEPKAEKKEPARDPSQGEGNQNALNGDPLLRAVLNKIGR